MNKRHIKRIASLILAHDDILKDLKAGDLIIGKPGEPEFEEDQVRESSIDLPIGSEFHRWKRHDEIERDPGLSAEATYVVLNLPPKQLAEELQHLQGILTERSQIAPDGTFTLQPGDFVLTQVGQFIQLPDYLAARVEGRTRFARAGLEVHSTAPTIRVGWGGHITLELKNVGPLVFRLNPGDRICQLILERVLTAPSVKLESQY